ncbi:MAG: hypothetical protein Q9228_004606 [Teloschistes exilis]
MRDNAKKRSYGTLASEHQSLMQTRHTPQEKRLRISMGFLLRYKVYGGLGVCLLLICFAAWTGDYHVSAGAPTRTPTGPSRDVHRNGQLPVYLWFVEHDPDSHDQGLATLKSLYTADRFLANATDCTLLMGSSYQPSSGWSADAMSSLSGCNSITDTSIWNLDRASYADVLLDNDSNSESERERYQGIREVDMIVCERAGFDITRASQIKHCRVVGSDYFSQQDPDRRPWLPARVFRVSPNFNLAFRPGHWSHHRVCSCLCSSKLPTVKTTAKASKSAHRLTVSCLDQSASMEDQVTSQGSYNDLRSFHREGKRSTGSSYAPPPGLYVLPNVLSESYMALSKVLELQDHTTNERIPSEAAIATRVATTISVFVGLLVIGMFTVGYGIMRWCRMRQESREDRQQRQAIELLIRPSAALYDGSPPALAIAADPATGSLQGSAGPTYGVVDETLRDRSLIFAESSITRHRSLSGCEARDRDGSGPVGGGGAEVRPATR